MDSPVIFQSVDGYVKHQETSKYNEEELEMVFRFIDELLKTDNVFGHTISAKDIGIVTPYSAQAHKATQMCMARNKYKGILAGTGPIFQGKEKTAIIVTMVANGTLSKFAADERVKELFITLFVIIFNVFFFIEF